MLKKLSKENMGTSNLGWLESRFHFSFAEYRNPNNMNFGVLRVLNDDIVHPESGFDTHPHANMEIISYVVNGEITHKDSMGNSETLKRGEVQYLSAGDGIYHSEHNVHKSDDLRLLQIWIVPPKSGLPRLYGSKRFEEIDRKNRLLNIVSSQKSLIRRVLVRSIFMRSCPLLFRWVTISSSRGRWGLRGFPARFANSGLALSRLAVRSS